MIVLTLSNGTQLDISISLREKAVTIRQSAKQTTAQSVAPDPVITIPLVDLKELVKSVKTLVGFLS